MVTTLDVRAVSDFTAARGDVESLGSAVRTLGTDVDTAGSQARSASVNFDALGEGSDNVASKSSQAAAGVGDLAGGLEAVGATGAASALNAVALASSVAAGAGDVLNLVAETSVGRWIANTAASVAHRTATIAGTAATGAMTVAQGALNAVMALNPVTIVVIALVALAAALVVAYRQSETFREIVDGAFTRARTVVGGAVDAVIDFIGWTRDLPGEAREAWEDVRAAIADKVGAAGDRVEDLIDDAKRLPREAASEIAGYFAQMFAPIQTAIGWVDDLIDRIRDIDFPDFPDFPGRVISGRESGLLFPTTSLATAEPSVVVNITVEGALDPDGVARTIVDTLRKANVRGLAFDGITLESA